MIKIFVNNTFRQYFVVRYVFVAIFISFIIAQIYYDIITYISLSKRKYLLQFLDFELFCFKFLKNRKNLWFLI
jgi:hypothetical protein